MKLTFLGTGTSFGIPVAGCDCEVCTSRDSRDRRMRHGALLTTGEGRSVLVDTPPELRLQLVREGVAKVDAVWFTHLHADHLHGIDDLRIFSIRTGRSIDAYASEDAISVLKKRFDYIFDPEVPAPRGSTKPQIALHRVEAGRLRQVGGLPLLPLEVQHGSTTVLGFRVGGLGYLTDAKEIPLSTRVALQGVDVLVLNALWFGNPHPSHLNVEEALALARELGAGRTYLTHLTHRVSHAELEARLPPGVEAAWDGLSVEIAGP